MKYFLPNFEEPSPRFQWRVYSEGFNCCVKRKLSTITFLNAFLFHFPS